MNPPDIPDITEVILSCDGYVDVSSNYVTVYLNGMDWKEWDQLVSHVEAIRKRWTEVTSHD